MDPGELWVSQWYHRVVRGREVTWDAGPVDFTNFPWRYPGLTVGYHVTIFRFSKISIWFPTLTPTSIPWRMVVGIEM